MYAALRKTLGLVRTLQLTITYAIALAMYLFTTIPHGWWIFLTVLVLSAAFEPGLIVLKSIHRIKGTCAALVICVPLIYLLQLNYRFIPLVLILSSCFIWVASSRRYDIFAFFITIMVFTLNAYNFTIPLNEGPFQVVLNRAICTIIGIIICLGGDYFLFDKYNYSRKLYSLLQLELCNLLEDTVKHLQNMEALRQNSYLTVEKLRAEFNQKFNNLAITSDSVILGLTASKKIKKHVKEFGEIIWQMRREAFAIYYCSCILKNRAEVDLHVKQFQQYLKNSKEYIIALC